MRCLALARAWRAGGGSVTFACAALPPALAPRLAGAGMAVVPISAPAGSPEDARQSSQLAHEVGAPWIVVDGYQFDAAYQAMIKARGHALLFIDDYGHATGYPADIVLNQNSYATPALYTGRAAGSRLLLGPAYALLRQEFKPWRGWQRTIPPRAQRLLVTLGGSDPDNVTGRVLQALQTLPPGTLETRLVVGGSNPHAATLQAALRPHDSIELLYDIDNMAEQMAWADLAVAASGSTCWELSFMGLPALLLILSENQAPIAADLTHYGSAQALGWAQEVTETQLREAILALRVAPERRQAMAEAARCLVDGRGCLRAIAAMLPRPDFAVRPVQPQDSPLLWYWANDPQVRANSFSTDFIPWTAHQGWFERKQQDHLCHFYLLLDGHGLPVGQARFDLDPALTHAIISVSLDASYRGQGHGGELIALAARQLLKEHAIDEIHAYIKLDNAGSLRAFTKAGFHEQGPKAEIGGHAATRFILERSTVRWAS